MQDKVLLQHYHYTYDWHPTQCMARNLLLLYYHYLFIQTYFQQCPDSLAARVLARISKMPVQNSNFNISGGPDFASNILLLLIPASFHSLVYQKGQSTLQLCPRRWFVCKLFGNYPPKVKIEKSS